jgi:hypothetical protein
MLLETSGRVVGHQAHIPVAVWVGGERLRLGVGVDTSVAPDFRGRGGMRLLVEAFLASEHGCDVRMNFPGEHARILGVRYGAGRFLGRLPRWERHYARPPVARLRARLLPGTVWRLAGSLASAGSAASPVEPLGEPGPEVDALAAASAGFAPCIRVRDAAYVRWRWLEQPGASWTLTCVRGQGGALRGFAVFGVRELDSGPRGRIVDLLAVDLEAARSLLCHASTTLAAEDCTTVVVECADPRPWSRWAFLRSGFLPAPRYVNVVCRSLAAEAGSVPERLEAWYLTSGDTDLV